MFRLNIISDFFSDQTRQVTQLSKKSEISYNPILPCNDSRTLHACMWDLSPDARICQFLLGHFTGFWVLQSWLLGFVSIYGDKSPVTGICHCLLGYDMSQLAAIFQYHHLATASAMAFNFIHFWLLFTSFANRLVNRYNFITLMGCQT